MTTEKIYEVSEAVVANFYETVTVNVWKDQRIYLNRPNQSKKYQDVGYIRISDMKAFPARPTGTSRDADAAELLQNVADALIAATAE
ncbi:MAG: hypothetical protein ACR2K1_03710 [Saprospiraceae bacterium]